MTEDAPTLDSELYKLRDPAYRGAEDGTLIVELLHCRLQRLPIAVTLSGRDVAPSADEFGLPVYAHACRETLDG